MRKTLRALWVFARTAFEADRRLAGLVLLLNLSGYGMPAIYAIGARELTDGALAGEARAAALGVGLLMLGFAIQYLGVSAQFVYQQRLREQTQLLLHSRLAALTAGIPTVEHLERPDYLKEVELLGQEHGLLADMQSAILWNVGTVAQFLIGLSLLASLDWRLLLVVLFGVPVVVQGVWAQRRRHRLQEATAERWRLHWQLHYLATTVAGGRELRIFGLGDEVLRRFGAVRAEDDRVEDRERAITSLVGSAAWLVFALGFAGAVWLVAQRTLAGQSTLGDVVLTITLTTSLGGSLMTLVMLGSWLTMTLKTAGRYLWLLDYAEEARRASASARRVAPVRLTGGITLEGVGFRYHGGDADVLSDVSLHLPAGATVAVVGENGAGKTTLVKLLCRFYVPTRGRILVDGEELAGFDVESWRARVSASFQDFAQLELIARETVGVGDLTSIDDRHAVESALDRAAAAELPAQLPAGLDTQLGRSFTDGHELSGGQWQKLSLGRAMMRPQPLLMVLDEPTAAIDAQTEHALFERYVAASRRVAAANGGITVLVSHRLSTVRMADLIVVMADGRVAEVGSHGQLVGAGGQYAEMYELQARAYR
jgi:ATP-binding cassette subfamily B protein